MTDPVLVEERPGWRLIRLNRPDKLNAMNEAMLDALIAVFDAIEVDRSCRAALITGEGRGFCAGQELSSSVMPGPGGPPDLGALAHRYHHALARRIRAARVPVVAAVNGVAAGAGASLALACDIVIAGHSASFIQAFVLIGLVPDTGSSFFLPRVVGEARARALLLTGDAVPAMQAAEWGMVWKAVDDASLMQEAEDLTERLAQGPASALARIKQLLAASFSNDLDTQLDLERDLQREAGRTADFAEGVRAFLEKRPVAFSSLE